MESTAVTAVTVYQSTETTALPFDMSLLAGTISQNTIDAYTSDFRDYVMFATERNLNPLTAHTLLEYRAYKVNNTQDSPNTINRKLAAVKKLMREAGKMGHLDEIEVLRFKDVEGVTVKALVARTKENARTRITPDDMRALTNAPGTETLKGLRDTAILHTLASSGLRCEELATLRVDKIRQVGKGYRVSVRGKNETSYNDAYLSVTAYNAIQSWLSARSIDSVYVFTGFEGRTLLDGTVRETDTAISGVGVWKLVQRYAAVAGLSHIKPHDFRRFVGTELATEHGIRKAQKALRHKSIETTARHYVLDELETGLTDNLY
jgi:integrase/recombinase XerD